jgi:methylglyoxal synthase
MLVALCAHDGSKDDLEEWAGRHSARLQDHDIISTGGTARKLEDKFGFKVRALPSGPRGGDVVLAGSSPLNPWACSFISRTSPGATPTGSMTPP